MSITLIFICIQTGGWTELENAAQYCKRNCKFHNDPAATNPKNCICLTSTTGSLNCRKIFFLSNKGYPDHVWNFLMNELNMKAWRSIYFSVEHSQLMNGFIESILTFFPTEKRSFLSFEIVFCIPSGRSRDLKELESICQKHLHSYPISFFIEDTRRNEGALTCCCK